MCAHVGVYDTQPAAWMSPVEPSQEEGWRRVEDSIHNFFDLAEEMKSICKNLRCLVLSIDDVFCRYRSVDIIIGSSKTNRDQS
jgi:hypothetical protein